MAGKAATAAKAAGANLALGGPEDPAADAASAKVAAGAARKKAAGGTRSASQSSPSSGSSSGRNSTSSGSGARSQGTSASKSDPGIWERSKKAQDKGQRWARRPGRKVLVAEFIVCLVIVGLGALGVEPTKASTHLVRRTSALMALFFILASVAAWGDGPRKAANGIGGLVTLTFLMTERQGFTALADYFTNAGSKSTADEGTLPTPTGGSNPVGTSGNPLGEEPP